MIDKINNKKIFLETYGWPMEALPTDFSEVFGEDLLTEIGRCSLFSNKLKKRLI